MAHKKAGGSTKNGRDSESKRLGVKIYGGQAVTPGNIIIGRDHTLFAKSSGHVKFEKKGPKNRQFVSIITN